MKYFNETGHEGGLIARYSGQGILTLDDGTDYEGEFQIEHHAELGVLLECDFRGSVPVLGRRDFQSFTGKTADGQFSVTSVGGADVRHTHFNVTDNVIDATIFWHIRGVTLERIDKPRCARVRYGITNFEFHGLSETTGFEDLPVTLSENDRSVEVVIKPHHQYKHITKFISLYGSVRVTCEACLDSAGSDFDERRTALSAAFAM